MAVLIDRLPGRVSPAPRAEAASSRHQLLATLMVVTAVAWGAMAFGSVYAWAYRALSVMALVAGALGLHAGRGRARTTSEGLLVSLGCVALIVAIQIVPLPLNVLEAVSPNGVDLLDRLYPAFAFSPGAHPLSMSPSATLMAGALFVCFVVLMLGVARLASAAGSRRIVEQIAIAGVVLALAGIVQKSLGGTLVYGFWAPEQSRVSPFGPFVNKNHFAGWMLMCLPLVLGYVCGGVASGLRGARSWRERLLWLSTPGANQLILTAAGVAVMGLALVLTMSRSGISALAFALCVTGWFALFRLDGRSRKLVAGAYLLFVATIVVGWAGVDIIATRFSEPDWGQLNGRAGAWADAAATFQRHWLTGTGLNTYQTVNLLHQQHDVETFVSAAHNDYLQLAAEGGMLLLLPVACALAFFIRDVRRRFQEDGPSSSYWLRAGAVTGLLAIGLQETVEFSLQMPGNAALFAVLCGIALHRPHARRSNHDGGGDPERLSGVRV